MPGRTHAAEEARIDVRQATELFASLDLDTTAAACAALAAETFGAPLVRLYLVSGSSVKSLAAFGAPGGYGRQPARVPRAVAQRLRRAAEQRYPVPDEEDPGTTLLPVQVSDGTAAVLALEATVSAGLDSWEARTFAGLAGTALANALAFRDMERHAGRLAELERMKSQFLNLASHELRGPLTVLMGYLSLLEDGAFGEVPGEFAATLPAINARLTEMESLINAMLDTARLEDDRLELAFTDEDLGDIAAEAVARAKPFLHGGQELHLARPQARVPVNVDRARIAIALGNLISNAIKYSVDHSDVRCEVSLEDDEAVVSITDHGIGIARDELPNLFTRFGRIRSDPAVRLISGTGLGLFLARELVRAHGGNITVESAPREGSTFRLCLPAAR
jgi:signal transduction histidine kinase